MYGFVANGPILSFGRTGRCFWPTSRCEVDHAFVAVEQQPGGWLYTVEFQTVCDDTLHKICLTAKSNFEAFLAWVQRNQATGVVINSTAERKPVGAGQKESAGLPGGIALRPVVMLGLFEAMVERKICGQFVVGNEGIVQGANMRPETLRLNESWVFLSEERCGMHLRRSEVTTVRLRPVEWE